MKKRILIVVSVLVPALVLMLGPLVIPFWSPRSRINCRQEEINVKTGRARYSRYLWFAKTSETVEDTVLSRVLAGEHVDANNMKPWQMVNTFSPACTHSSHYRYHGALAQARRLECILKRFVPNVERDREVAREILRLWQTTGGVNGVCPYLFRVSRADKWTDGKWSLGQVPLPEESPEQRYFRLIRERNEAAAHADPEERYRNAVELHRLLSEQGTDYYTLWEKHRARLLSESERKVLGKIEALRADVQRWALETPDANVAQEDQDAAHAVIAELRGELSSRPKLKRSLGELEQWDNIGFHFYDGRRCRVAFEWFYGESKRAFSGVMLYLVKDAGKWELVRMALP